MMDFASAVQAAAGSSPHRVYKTHGRVLLVDGDALAYTSAGGDDCSPGQARANLVNKVNQAKHASGADSIKLLLTARYSHKGHRYSIARVKPYQGQRSSGRRPKNWQYLRDLLEQGGVPFDIESTATLEADDLFHHYSVLLGAENVVIYTQDKDLRMVPGWHLRWDDNDLCFLKPGVFRMEHGGKVFGNAWFWVQMLQGDTADNIPGLPWFYDGHYSSGANKGKLKPARCGEKSNAVKGLAFQGTNERSFQYCMYLYEDVYQERAAVEILEQACLLWMRRTPSVLDCTLPGGPLNGVFSLDEAWVQQEIIDRTKVQQQDIG
ncbi:hypothetical protein UFOVP60_37 [uncultured Caudovirales phage]|uniref:5'-3' exonuclease n=1 Tax=uncultured Caudovirales phage TaxID=2100421 RepID=A0A6J5T9I2_9CAUD|nr:hypothetical protein UFOVP60_37 [uncultured Caudovirales phage]